MTTVTRLLTIACACAAGSAAAQFDLLQQQQKQGEQPRITHIEAMPPSPVVRYADNSVAELESHTVWQYMCGSDESGKTKQDMLDAIEAHRALVASTDPIVIDSGLATRGGGMNLIFNVSGSLPGDAASALADAEAFLENFFFDDPVTITINMSFANLGGGVLGQTGSNRLFDSWTDSRAGLVNGMDQDDTIQDFLPTGTTLPVRYNASSSAVTNEGRVEWTRANYKATVGAAPALDATMTFNSAFSWDWDPSNGVGGFQSSFVDVVIHEVGHALGFVSRAESFFSGGNSDLSTLDIYRFQRTDGSGDFNPDTTAEFQTTPRTVDFNNPNNDVNSDLIDVEYRMSDGSPSQASHFLEQGNNIGLMDPSLAGGQTFFSRGYWSQADIDMFDAIGWNYSTVCFTTIDVQPEPETQCEGGTYTTTVEATGPNLTYQWFGPSGILSGQTTDTLTVTGLTPADAGDYSVLVDGDCGAIFSDTATLEVTAAPSITDQPDSQTADEGDNVSFTVVSTGSGLSYTWFGPSGFLPETSNTLTVNNVTLADAGGYSCIVSSDCGFANSQTATLTVNTSADCPADVNDDGAATPADFTAWLGCFNNPASAPFCDRADVNNSGAVDPADFTAWLAAFNAGCP